jgi:hydroxymethylpyrimidine pyrophosphatase-like HAD family hydrolase
MRPRMLACDLDGTLVHSRGEITEATIAALRAALESGVETVIATGRRHSFAQKVLAPLRLPPETVLISSNGAIIRSLDGQLIHRIAMPSATARLLCEQLDEFRASLIFTFDRTGPGSLMIEDIDALRERIPRWVDSNAHEIACCVPLERAFERGDEPLLAMICGTLREMGQAMEVLTEVTRDTTPLGDRLSIHRTEYADRDLCIVDLMAAGASKGSALARLAAMRGFDAAQVAAIGDNMNDADMLAFAGHAIVMRNAAADLHELARQNGWTLADGHDDDGAASAILSSLQRTNP